MKIRTYKNDLYRALLWYQDKMQEKFVGTLIHSASLYEMEAYLHQLQLSQQRCETNVVWQIPVFVKTTEDRRSFTIGYDESEVLILDFDR